MGWEGFASRAQAYAFLINARASSALFSGSYWP